jgi:hypothetical protein
MDRWTRLGIEAYRSGNRAQAQRFFRFALMENPDDVRCWLWLVEVVDTQADKKHCLEQVLRIDPSHSLARKALEDLNDLIASGRLPHVSPFGGFGSELAEPEQALIPASIEVRSTPPFMEELAHKDDLAQPTLPFWRRDSFWRITGAVMVGLAVVAAIMILVIR